MAVVRVLELHCPLPARAYPSPIERSTGLGAELPEIARTFTGGQKLRGSSTCVYETLALIVREEEQFVFNDRAGNRAVEHVVAQLRFSKRAIHGMTQSTLELRQPLRP